MRKKRTPIMLALAGLISSLMTFVSSGTASAAESIPTLQWPAFGITGSQGTIVTGPNGDVTVPCSSPGTDNLKTYNSSGQVVRELSSTAVIDGYKNCIEKPVVDKNGTLYGLPRDAGWVGPNILAYEGNTLKWKYPVTCANNNQMSPLTVGANGNIYAITVDGGKLHLVGVEPKLRSGESQPTRVLDIELDAETQHCASVQLQPFDDGLMAYWPTGKPRFYSYGGKFLNESSISMAGYQHVNVEGQLHGLKTIAGSPAGREVWRYNPHNNSVEWSKSVSTPGSAIRGQALSLLPDGGVAVLILEQKITSSGVPVTPEVLVHKLHVFNADGQKVRLVELPNTGSNGIRFGQGDAHTVMTSDDNGNLVFVRKAWKNVTTASGTVEMPLVSIGAYNIVQNSWFYQKLMMGDDQKAGGPYGYSAGGVYLANGQYGPALGADTLYLAARCAGNCSFGSKVFPVKILGVGREYPRSSVLTADIPQQPAAVPYVALGDSFSSGEGVEPFEPSPNDCHRSEFAYSKVVSNNVLMAPDLKRGKFAACSGATTNEVQFNNDANDEIAQVEHLTDETKVVSITIGGNDIGFVDFGLACIAGTCDWESDAFATVEAKLDELPSKLTDTYLEILDRTTVGQAKIYVLGYPHLAPVKLSTDDDDIRCTYLHDGGDGWGDAHAARSVVDMLNQKIETTVNAVRDMDSDNTRLQYVEVNGSDSPFDGHTMCSEPGESYFNNLDQAIGHQAYALHPNARGQRAYAELLIEALNTNDGYIDPDDCPIC